jgi:hypothetical protein
LVPGEPSVTATSATAASPVTSEMPASWTLVSVSADCVTHCAYITTALFVRLTTTVWLPVGIEPEPPRW